MVSALDSRMSGNAAHSSSVHPGVITNPVEGAGDTAFDSADEISTGLVGGFSKLGHGLSRGVGSLLAAPFTSAAPAKK